MKMNLHHSQYDPNTKTLYGHHQSGFYSCINQVRNSVYTLLNEEIIPENISFQSTLNWYRNNEDLYPILYKLNLEKKEELKKYKFNLLKWDPTYELFNNLDLKQIKLIEEVYFSPSDTVLNCIENLEKKYNINYNNTLAVLHRGTDKYKEAKLQTVDWWMEQCDLIVSNADKILFQSDELQFKNKFLEKYKENIFTFEEMIFENEYITPKTNKIEWSVNFESIMRIISKCYKIFTHAGNGGIIPILYKGNIKNVYQCNHEGKFINYNEKNNNI
jgi:hypothetical protein